MLLRARRLAASVWLDDSTNWVVVPELEHWVLSPSISQRLQPNHAALW